MPITVPTRLLRDVHASDHLFKETLRRRESQTFDLSTGFDFPAQLAGSTPDGMAHVYYDPALGTRGATVAGEVLKRLPIAISQLETFFTIPVQTFTVMVVRLNNATDGSGGGYHLGCTFASGADLYCDVALDQPDLTFGLVVAELSETFMGTQGKGWDCGGSNGEALSRFLAQHASGGPDGVLSEYSTGPDWDSSGRPNWIDANESTDKNPASIGCGVLYLYWMLSRGFSIATIVATACPQGTLASNYFALTGSNSAWADFLAAVPGRVSSDDPWNIHGTSHAP